MRSLGVTLENDCRGIVYVVKRQASRLISMTKTAKSGKEILRCSALETVLLSNFPLLHFLWVFPVWNSLEPP